MNEQMPPSIAYCLAKNLFGSGSEFYRCHRPATLLGNEQYTNWLSFVATNFAPPESAGQHWDIEIEGRPFTPQVIVARPFWAMEGDDDKGFDAVDQMTQSIAYAQEGGQIVLGDIDDHPFAWAAEMADREQVEQITDWSWFDRYLKQFNAVLCSTKWLVNFLGERYPDQVFAYAPNLYDPWRYKPELAHHSRTLGSHLYVKARLAKDFERIAPLTELFESIPDVRFRHTGEEFACANCGHYRRHHYSEKAECDDCACELYVEGANDSLARLAGIPAGVVDPFPACSIFDLPDRLDFGVGIVPLADSPFNYAKTEGKGFEMAAAGIPFVALTGDHPLYKQSPGHLGSTPGDAIEGISALINDPIAWTQASEIHRSWAELIAIDHQDHYLAAMTELSKSDLRK